MSAADAPGWHGKLPSLGDFASRRLTPEFVEAWDGWLAGGLAALRQAGPETWLDGYLASPVWRYLLMPGCVPGASGQQAWSGVLMPSVDRAGRYFPFTVAHALDALPRSQRHFDQLQRWLHELDDLAADALQDDWPVARLEAELERLPAPRLAAAASPRPSTVLAGSDALNLVLASAADVTRLVSDDGLGFWQTAVSGQAFWWCEPGTGPARLVVTRGLPAGAALGTLLGGPADEITLPPRSPAGPART